MKGNHVKDALESIAHRAVPEDVNLMPNIAARLERKSFMVTLRARPALMILLVLLALALLSGVAYAIGKATGYIPGVGLVDQSISLRRLAQPVTLTRDGISLTVEQVVLSADKTVVIYKVEGIPDDAYGSETGESGDVSSYSSSMVVPLDGTPDGSSTTMYEDGTCFSEEHLLLPDGSVLPMQTGEGSGWASGFENRHVFGPLPMGVNEATFVMSCIPQTKSGMLPENWEISLQFVPASPDVKVLPVFDISVPAADESQRLMILERVIETDEGYILVGKFRSIGLPEHAVASGERQFLKISDANGQVVNAAHANGIDVDGTFGEFGLAYEIKGKQHAWPLSLVLDEVVVLFYQQSTEFEFDTGPNSQVGQTWILKPEVELMGYTIHEVAIERRKQGYGFTIKSDPDVLMVIPEIKGFPYTRAGGGGDGYGRGETYYQGEFKGEVPSGKLTVQLGWLRAIIHGPWQVQWSPGVALPTP